MIVNVALRLKLKLLSLKISPETAGGGGCCFVVDINNGYGNPIVGLNAQILTPDWIFNTGSVNVPAGWNWATIPSNDNLTVEYSGGTFPAGPTANVLRFCMADADPVSPTPQQILFSWLEVVGNDTIAVCDTLIITDCQSNPGEECATIIIEQVECTDEPNVYEVTFEVFNNTPNVATSLLLYGLTAGYSFKTSPTGAPLTGLVLPVSIAAFSTSTPITIYIESLLPITSLTNIYFNYGITGQGFCCFVAQPFCIQLPPCYCLVTSNFNIECVEDSSKYRLTFDVTNKSTITPSATGLVVTVLNGPPITLVPSGGFFDWTTNPLPYNATRTITTCVTPFPIIDPAIILDYTLHHGSFPNIDPNLCCYDIPSDTIPIPDCCDELVIDGDFDDVTGSSFTSSLTQNCNCAVGSWCIDVDADNKCSTWPNVLGPQSCSDNYLIVDGAIGTIWSQPVDVIKDECYEFSFQYHPNISGGGQPNLNIVVGLDIIGSTNGVSGNWTSYTYNYTAPFTGTFNLSIVQTNNTQFSDYGIDCISFGCVPCNPCPPIIVFPAGSIPSGVHQASQGIKAAGTVVTGTDVDLKAGERIELENGFAVETGSDFSAYIEPCCCTDDPLNDLTWLQPYIGDPNYSISRGVYQNQCIFIVTDFCIFSDGVTAYYDCQGNQICYVTFGANTCPANFNVQNITVLQGC